jgi:hypothetical protein
VAVPPERCKCAQAEAKATATAKAHGQEWLCHPSAAKAQRERQLQNSRRDAGATKGGKWDMSNERRSSIFLHPRPIGI